MQDTLIRNARILDGSGTDAIEADLRIVGSRIGQIGKNLPEGESALLDAEGQVLCPGFIDMHSHADLALLTKNMPDQKIRQGVTTELLGQDGLGVAPVNVTNLRDLQEIINGLQGYLPAHEWTWNTFGEYLDRLEHTPLPNNVAVLATHAPLRLATVGMSKRTAVASELVRMQDMLNDCMQSGAYGFSSGLEYPPQYNADQDELAALNKVVAQHDGIYVVHQRNEGHHLQESFREQLGVGRISGVHLHISHLKAWGPANWHRIDQVLDEAQSYHEAGGAITWDRYPYLSGSTLLGIILPHWTWLGGTEKLIGNLSLPGFRDKLRRDFQSDNDEWENDPGSIGWHNIFISGVNLEDNRWMEGKSIAEISVHAGLDEVDLVCDLLASERLAVTGIFFYGCQPVLEKVLSHPLACVGSDGILLGQPHPRLYGSFPLFLEEFALKSDILSLPEAVRKITNLPANILGLQKRGLIKEGYFADLVVFDPVRLHAPVDYQKTDRYPEGISHVFLDGKWIVKNGKFSGEAKGKVLRKGA